MRLPQARVSVMPQPNIEPANDRAGQAAAIVELTHGAGVEQSEQNQRLGGDKGGGENEKPDRQPLAGLAMGDFQRRRAQAEARPLRQRAEQHADEGAAQRQRIAVADEIDKLVQHQGLI